MEESIRIENGDKITAEDYFGDGELSVKIENQAFVEPVRWIHVGVVGQHDRASMIDDLIHALTQLRDQ